MDLENILQFLHLAETGKDTLRHSWTSKGRQESIAEHSWRLSIMAILLTPHLKSSVNQERVQKMIAVHDLAETITGDIPAQIHQNDAKIKKDRERNEVSAMKEITEKLGGDTGKEIYDLWLEQHEGKTTEAKFVKALDKIEVRIQHNEADIKTWNKDELPRALFAADRYCKFDEAIRNFNEIVKFESVQKLEKAGENIRELGKEAQKLKKTQL